MNILKKVFKQQAGRNNQGRITIRYRGGGKKYKRRMLDYLRNIWYVVGIVLNVEHEFKRSAKIALISYINGVFCYIIAVESIKRNQFIISGKKVPLFKGNSLPIYQIPKGSFIHNIETITGLGGKMCRSAGTKAQIIKKTHPKLVVVKIKSSKRKHKDCEVFLNKNNIVTLGIVSNKCHFLLKKKKAGENRLLGLRPKVRGVAMNPIDHPHGGGEGKTSGGRCSVTPWSVFTKGYKTQKKEKKKRKRILRIKINSFF